MKRGKKWISVAEKIDPSKFYNLDEAVSCVKETSFTKFTGSIDVALKISYKSLQDIRGVIHLPHGSGKKIKVLVFAGVDRQAEAKEAGADYVGGSELIEKISKESWTDFDACVATPDMMKEVGRLGPILGRKGLMPRPKSGTVTIEVGQAVKNLKSGMCDYRPDKGGVIHLRVGSSSFEDSNLVENLRSVYQSILRDKPSDAKGEYISSLFISATMGPSVRIRHKSLV